MKKSIIILVSAIAIIAVSAIYFNKFYLIPKTLEPFNMQTETEYSVGDIFYNAVADAHNLPRGKQVGYRSFQGNDDKSIKIYELRGSSIFDYFYFIEVSGSQSRLFKTSYAPMPKGVAKEDLFITDEIGYSSIASGWTPLKKLPKNYTKDEAIADGCYVKVNAASGQQAQFNKQAVTDFINTVLGEIRNDIKPYKLTGTPAFLRSVMQTIEGDFVITDYYYDGEKFIVNRDTTRDAYGNIGITSQTYRYMHSLIIEGFANPAYFLSDDPLLSAEDLSAAGACDGLPYIE